MARQLVSLHSHFCLKRCRVFLLLSPHSFKCIMDQIINNQLKVSPRRGGSHFPTHFFLATLEVWYNHWVDVPWVARGLFKEHSNRPIFPVKIGVASWSQLDATCTTHTSLHWLCTRAPQSPALQVMSSPLCLALAPYSSHFHSLAQIWSHLPHNCINISVLLHARAFLFFPCCFSWIMKC